MILNIKNKKIIRDFILGGFGLFLTFRIGYFEIFFNLAFQT